MIIDKQLLQEAIDNKLVSVQKHPDANLFIYNYTQKVQYDKLWDEITKQTRGLILDSEMNIIARPFGKFFNIEEHQANDIPDLPFEVFEKMDGSLGILYWLNNNPFIATRGSFNSDQAQHANKILYEKYQDTFDKLDNSKTYLFEIIYPDNRIVVDYGGIDDLVLLSIIDNKTGIDLPIDDIGFPIVKRYDGINDIEQLRTLEEDNKEGFVIKFNNGFRVKMKFAEYVRLHRIITGVSNIAIWEYLLDGKDFDELLAKVPDEFYSWVNKTINELKYQYNYIEISAKEWYLLNYNEDRKTFALAVQEYAQHLSSILFSMYNNRDYSKIIWKMIRPKFSKPFNQIVVN